MIWASCDPLLFGNQALPQGSFPIGPLCPGCILLSDHNVSGSALAPVVSSFIPLGRGHKWTSASAALLNLDGSMKLGRPGSVSRSRPGVTCAPLPVLLIAVPWQPPV